MISAKKVQELAIQQQEEIVAIRRHLHSHPELSFMEFNTSKFVAEKSVSLLWI